ncbi:MAG: hypothetical protein ABIB61_01080 [Candidatus Shapirobacteria bacterium]
MKETLANEPDAIVQAQEESQNRRVEVLNTSGFKGWFSQIESQVAQGLIPSLTSKEGVTIADKFSNLTELAPAQPAKSTETPIMEAITDDLKTVFGEGVESEIDTLVTEQIMPLRGKEDEEIDKPNKYLVIAIKNVLRDVMAVARVFQLTDDQLKELYSQENPEQMRAASLMSLELSLLTRSLKGIAREKGYCKKAMHEEHIWTVRGLRDVPRTGLAAIGEFIDKHLAS